MCRLPVPRIVCFYSLSVFEGLILFCMVRFSSEIAINLVKYARARVMRYTGNALTCVTPVTWYLNPEQYCIQSSRKVKSGALPSNIALPNHLNPAVCFSQYSVNKAATPVPPSSRVFRAASKSGLGLGCTRPQGTTYFPSSPIPKSPDSPAQSSV